MDSTTEAAQSCLLPRELSQCLSVFLSQSHSLSVPLFLCLSLYLRLSLSLIPSPENNVSYLEVHHNKNKRTHPSFNYEDDKRTCKPLLVINSTMQIFLEQNS